MPAIIPTPSAARTPRRRAALCAIAATAWLAAAAPSSAWAQPGQDWPARPVKLVVPFPPGGSTDAIARLLAAALAQDLAQPVVVENKAGANGGIGADQVAKAAPDGYTLLLSGIGSNATNYAIYRAMPYGDADFAHIALLATGPGVLAAHGQFPARDFASFVALAQQAPGRYAHASAGNGSSGHLAMEMLKQTLALELTHVPYRGNGPAVADVVGGQVPLVVLNNDVALPLVKAGRLRALAVTSAARNPAYPGVPTLAESGVPDFDVVSWFGLSAPAGTPAPIIQRLAGATHAALQSPRMRQYLEDSGFVAAAGGSPQDYRAFVAAEIARWRGVVERAGIPTQ